MITEETMNDTRMQVSAETHRKALELVANAKAAELPGFHPLQTGDDSDDEYLHPQARVRAFFRLHSNESDLEIAHVLTLLFHYCTGEDEVRERIASAIAEGELTYTADFESGFLFLDRDGVVRLMTRCFISPGYLCEMLTGSEPERDLPAGRRDSMFWQKHQQPAGHHSLEYSAEYSIPQWLLAEMLAAVLSGKVNGMTATRFTWTGTPEELPGR